jgi:hypothetical protein
MLLNSCLTKAGCINYPYCKLSGGKIIGKKLDFTKPLATLERQHNKYLANLPIWDQYIVWTYTLGSQPVNRRLVGAPVEPKFSHKWAYEFFNNFKYGARNVSPIFNRWSQFFQNPKSYLSLPDDDKNEIDEQLLSLYTYNLQSIILRAPPTTGEIIVYKASTPYDTRLLESNFPVILHQPPFNSTSFDPWFDYNAFLGSNTDTCCLWEITIPKGSHVLAIAHPFQAYLTEREILLPYDSIFEVISATEVDMSYYTDREAPTRTQNPPYLIGEVFRHDSWEQRPIDQRRMRMLIARVQTPNSLLK